MYPTDNSDLMECTSKCQGDFPYISVDGTTCVSSCTSNIYKEISDTSGTFK